MSPLSPSAAPGGDYRWESTASTQDIHSSGSHWILMEEEFLSCTFTVVDGNDYKESDC